MLILNKVLLFVRYSSTYNMNITGDMFPSSRSSLSKGKSARTGSSKNRDRRRRRGGYPTGDEVSVSTVKRTGVD